MLPCSKVPNPEKGCFVRVRLQRFLQLDYWIRVELLERRIATSSRPDSSPFGPGRNRLSRAQQNTIRILRVLPVSETFKPTFRQVREAGDGFGVSQKRLGVITTSGFRLARFTWRLSA